MDDESSGDAVNNADLSGGQSPNQFLSLRALLQRSSSPIDEAVVQDDAHDELQLPAAGPTLDASSPKTNDFTLVLPTEGVS